MATTSKQEFMEATGITMHGMTHKQLQKIAKSHMKQFSPSRYNELKKLGALDEVTMQMADRVQDGIDDLMEQGYQQHEAESMMMREHIRLPPEPKL